MKEKTGYVSKRTTVTSTSYTYSDYDVHVKNTGSGTMWVDFDSWKYLEKWLYAQETDLYKCYERGYNAKYLHKIKVL